MRDKRFIAEHRGGLLKKEQHIQLILWACKCTEHIITLSGGEPDQRLFEALSVARDWAAGKKTVGNARKAAVRCIAAANETTDPFKVAIARAAGHAVATAHMADHSLGPALYGLKAVKYTGISVEEEREWQNAQLEKEIKELVITSRNLKEEHFRF